MEIYRITNVYGDGIVLINEKVISKSNYDLYTNSHEWNYIGKQSFSDKILKKLDIQKTLAKYGYIDITHFD